MAQVIHSAAAMHRTRAFTISTSAKPHGDRRPPAVASHKESYSRVTQEPLQQPRHAADTLPCRLGLLFHAAHASRSHSPAPAPLPPQACRDAYRPWVNKMLWVVAELAIAATDLAEVRDASSRMGGASWGALDQGCGKTQAELRAAREQLGSLVCHTCHTHACLTRACQTHARRWWAAPSPSTCCWASRCGPVSGTPPGAASQRPAHLPSRPGLETRRARVCACACAPV